MLLYHIVVLAVVQGVTEFLPVSSSAHLALVPALLDLPDQGVEIDVAAHFGSLLAVLLYFRKDILAMITGGVHLMTGRKSSGGMMFVNVIIATVPVIVVGFFVYTQLEDMVRNIELLIVVNAVFALILWLSDLLAPKHKHKQAEGMAVWEALLIGLAQMFAVVPGVSRSGVTMSAARLLGYTHDQGARFSLLLSIPTIAGAVVLSGLTVYKAHSLTFSQDFLTVVGLSFITAMVAIDIMMRWFRRAGFTPFVIYRLALSAVMFFVLTR